MSAKWNAATRYSAHPFTTKTGARVHFFCLNYPRIRGWYQARVHPFSSGNGKGDQKGTCLTKTIRNRLFNHVQSVKGRLNAFKSLKQKTWWCNRHNRWVSHEKHGDQRKQPPGISPTLCWRSQQLCDPQPRLLLLALEPTLRFPNHWCKNPAAVLFEQIVRRRKTNTSTVRVSRTHMLHCQGLKLNLKRDQGIYRNWQTLCDYLTG